jgi:DNA-binding response OmpR family regulator
VLLVEDDDRVAAALSAVLARHGMGVRRVARGREAFGALRGVELVLLDLGLPDVDGMEVCRRVRAAVDVPLIILTARAGVGERVLALHSGADDYVVKPCDVGELVARMHAVARRCRPAPSPAEVVEWGDVTVDLAAQRVLVDGRPVMLTRKEFQVLALISAGQGTVCTRERLVAQAWGRSWRGANRTLDVHVAAGHDSLGGGTGAGRAGCAAGLDSRGQRPAAGVFRPPGRHGAVRHPR